MSSAPSHCPCHILVKVIQFASGDGSVLFGAIWVEWNKGGSWNSSASIFGQVRRARKMSSMLWFARAIEFVSAGEPDRGFGGGVARISSGVSHPMLVFKEKRSVLAACGERKARLVGCVGSQEPGPEKKESNKLGSKIDCNSYGWVMSDVSGKETLGASLLTLNSLFSASGVSVASALIYWQGMLRTEHREQLGRFRLHLALSATHWWHALRLRLCGWDLLQLFFRWRISDDPVGLLIPDSNEECSKRTMAELSGTERTVGVFLSGFHFDCGACCWSKGGGRWMKWSSI